MRKCICRGWDRFLSANRVSVDIVREVILWGRERGYRFLPLERNSPPARHRIAN